MGREGRTTSCLLGFPPLLPFPAGVSPAKSARCLPCWSLICMTRLTTGASPAILESDGLVAWLLVWPPRFPPVWARVSSSLSCSSVSVGRPDRLFFFLFKRACVRLTSYECALASIWTYKGKGRRPVELWMPIMHPYKEGPIGLRRADPSMRTRTRAVRTLRTCSKLPSGR